MPRAGPRPTYFIPPNFDNPPYRTEPKRSLRKLPPPDGPLKLGQLIADPLNPGDAINPHGWIDPRKYKIPVPIYEQSVSLFENTQHADTQSEVSLWTRAVEGICARLQLSVKRSDIHSALSKVQTLDTFFIQPTDEYVEESMQDVKVQRAMKLFWSVRRKIYMITGIKVARPGADDSISSKSEASSTVEIEGEGSAPTGGGSGTAGGGGKVERSSKASHEVSFIPARPFVYAYRLHQCHYRGEAKPYTTGALLSRGGRESSLESELTGRHVQELQFVCDGVDEECVTLGEIGMCGAGFEAQEEAGEDESTWVCIVPGEISTH